MRTGGIFPPRINKKAVITEELTAIEDIEILERPGAVKKKGRQPLFPSRDLAGLGEDKRGASLRDAGSLRARLRAKRGSGRSPERCRRFKYVTIWHFVLKIGIYVVAL